MTTCLHHTVVLRMNLAAISGHRRHKIAASVARAIAKQCPACRDAKEHK